mmetsp:Transcript_21316/g.68107  ORF Transcript_21316/g.68107 Transcript_21316/m.68107 type:complete len:312 (-) Transcript_21316:210-1145(-)
MKIFVIYDHASAPASAHHKLAITLPAKWLELSVDKVKAAFVAAYNKKFADAPLDGDSFALQVRDDSPFTHSDVRTLRTVDVPAKALSDRCEVRLVPHRETAAPGATASARPRCKRYGCQVEYDPATNHEAACRHHRLPPMFHDTRKWWTCCADIKVYSFDELMQVPGCAIGHHSADPPPQEVERQRAMAEATARVHAAHAEGAKKFYQAPKPDAAGNAPPPDYGAAAAPPAPPPPRKRPPLPEGRARCRHPGCNAEYSVAENHSSACRYHLKPPLFHEGSKQWQCCGVKKWDFDDFLAVPGCAVGPHEPDE